MISSLAYNILLNLKNIPGWRTSRKMVVIECDDWGSIRMPSKSVYSRLTAAGIGLNPSRYNRYDTMETRDDLELLFDVLHGIKDKNDHPAVMTAITNMANPDFEKIRSTGFSEYHYETFTETLTRYYPNQHVFRIWQEGLDAGVFVPELHGREHIAVPIWMEKLRQGDKGLLAAFDQGFVSLAVDGVPDPAREFRAEFYFTNEDQKPFLIHALKDSVSLYRKIFGRPPRVFVPADGIFHPDFDLLLGPAGIRFMYVSTSMPYPSRGGEMKNRWFIAGQKGPAGLTYYTRNCAFEPNDPDYPGIDLTMKQIESAFRWGKPANISSHRVNFAGGLDPRNRANGLKELDRLLKAIVKKWPDVEFLGSREALVNMTKAK